MSVIEPPVITDFPKSATAGSFPPNTDSDHTQISFRPGTSHLTRLCGCYRLHSVAHTPSGFVDLPRFGVQKGWSADLLGLMRRRVYDVAATVASAGVKVRHLVLLCWPSRSHSLPNPAPRFSQVYLNGKRVPVDSPQSYLALFPELQEGKMCFTQLNQHWF
jgi:hypothetical protein